MSDLPECPRYCQAARERDRLAGALAETDAALGHERRVRADLEALVALLQAEIRDLKRRLEFDWALAAQKAEAAERD